MKQMQDFSLSPCSVIYNAVTFLEVDVCLQGIGIKVSVVSKISRNTFGKHTSCKGVRSPLSYLEKLPVLLILQSGTVHLTLQSP
jgi:hypothetical protein